MSVVRPQRKQKWGVIDVNRLSFSDAESTQPPYFIKWESLPFFTIMLTVFMHAQDYCVITLYVSNVSIQPRT